MVRGQALCIAECFDEQAFLSDRAGYLGIIFIMYRDPLINVQEYEGNRRDGVHYCLTSSLYSMEYPVYPGPPWRWISAEVLHICVMLSLCNFTLFPHAI